MKNVKSTEVILMRSRVLTILFSMLISALLLLPLLSSAKGKDKIEANSKVFMQPLNKGQHAVITITGVDEAKYTLSIESENGGNVYYSKFVKSPAQFSKAFDFSNLEDGSYKLKVNSINETSELSFDIINGKIKVYYNEKENAEFNVVGEKATFMLPNSNNLTYSFRVIDENGNELYSANVNEKGIKKVFDFSNVEAGNYQILASSNRNSYFYQYEKKK